MKERPAERARGHRGRGPARRAVFRWAWRMFCREWRQQLLVLGLLTAAVTATTVAAAIAVNLPSSPGAATFGTANHLVTLPGSDQHLAADIAAIKQRFGPVEVIESRGIATGDVQGVQFRAQDPAGPFGGPTLVLVSGRYPAGPAQVAVTSQVATLYNLRTGSAWRQGGRSYRVVGIVQNPSNLQDAFVLVAAGQLSSPAQVTILFDASQRTVASYRFPAGATAATPPGAASAAAADAILVLAVATIGLLFVGLVAVAGFTVMAHRRIRAIGMLGAVGATGRQLRLVLVANGALVGAIGAVAGAVIGTVTWIAVVPALQAPAGHQISRFSMPWWAVGFAVVMAILTALLAAWWPARSAARMPVVAALSGRPEKPKQAHRFAVVGGLLLALGLLCLSFADLNGGNGLLVVAGIVTTGVGVALIGPVGIALLAGAANRTPIAVRIALRDLARYRSRSGAALAAVSLAAGITVIIIVSATQAATQARQATQSGPNLAANQLILYVSPAGPRFGVVPLRTAAELADLTAQVHSLASSLRANDVLTLESATSPRIPVQPAQVGQGGQVPPGLATVSLVKLVSSCAAPASAGPGYGRPMEGAGYIYLATPALLRHYGIEPSSISQGTDILSSRTDLAGVQLATNLGPQGCDSNTPNQLLSHLRVQVASLPTDTSAPNTLLTSQTLHALGWRAVTTGWLIQTPRPLTAAQINTARQVALAAGVGFEIRSGGASLTEILYLVTLTGVLVALGMLAMTVGLIRSETAGDLRTLAAAGAASGARRTVTAATAGAIALLAAIIGTIVGYLSLIAWHRTNLDTLTNVPVADLVIVVVGLPLAATLGGWLTAGREPPTIARQPIE
jgi:putative ABC transport system permease protein